MSAGPNQPQPQNSSELQRGLEQLWSNVLKPDPVTGRLTKETRKTIQDALGAEKLTKILAETSAPKSALASLNPLDLMKEPVVQAYAMQRICREMAATRAGFFHHIHEQEHDPTTKATRKIMWPPLAPGGPTSSWALGHVVNDPDTKEADALFWLYSQLSNAGNVNTLAPIFEQVTEAETKDAGILVKMQQIHNEITADKENFNIGTPGKFKKISSGTPGIPGAPATKKKPATAPTPGIAAVYDVDSTNAGTGQMARLLESIVLHKNEAEGEIARFADPKSDKDEVTKCQNKIDVLENKKLVLEAKLLELDFLAQSLSSKPGPVSPAVLSTMAEKFSLSYLSQPTFIGYKTTEIELGDQRNPIQEWIQNKELPTVQTRITRRYRMAGEGAPPATLALDELIRTYFGARLTGTPQAEQETFFQEMRTILLSAEHGHGGAGGAHAAGAPGTPHAPGAAHGGAHATTPKGSNLLAGFWDFLTR